MSRLDVELPLVARFTSRGGSLLLHSLLSSGLLSISVLVSAQTPQQVYKAPAAGAKSTTEKAQPKAAAGKREKPGANRAEPAGATPKIPAAPKDVDKGIATTGEFRDVISDKTPPACHPRPKRPDCAMDACAEVLRQDYTIVGEVECLRFSEDQASLIYTTSQPRAKQ